MSLWFVISTSVPHIDFPLGRIGITVAFIIWLTLKFFVIRAYL